MLGRHALKRVLLMLYLGWEPAGHSVAVQEKPASHDQI